MPADYGHQILEAARLLAVAGIVRIAYTTARDSAAVRGVWPAAWRGAAWAFAIALFAAAMAGQASCVDAGDGMFGGCLERANNGFTPSLDYQGSIFLFWAILLLVPIGMGVAQAGRRSSRPSARNV